MNTETIITALRTLFVSGDVFEIRVLDAVLPGSSWQHTQSGYFDYDHIELVPKLLNGFKTYGGVYVTLNPVNPDLLARANNRFKKAKSRETTGDKDIICRRWLLIDVDPVRPAGISATDAERNLSFEKAMEISEGLASMGFPAPMYVNSGNGSQLLYKIELPADDGGLVQQCLQALSPCSTEAVQVDLSVHNPARICRLPGTWNRKGDSTQNRPHRLAEILERPEQIEVVSKQLLRQLAGTEPEKPQIPTGHVLASAIDDFNSRGDIASLLGKYGWKLKADTDQQYWYRPGKQSGQHSATFNGDVFYVFSSNALPFDQNKGYSKFAVYSMLEHGGNNSAAIRALELDGYGNLERGVDLSGFMAGLKEQSQISEYCKEEQSGDPLISIEDNNCFDLAQPFPDHLLKVPGMIGEIIDYTLRTAPYPNKTLALCGAITYQSYAIARRVKDSTDQRSSIYIAALANSGVGKDHPRKVNSKIALLSGMLAGIGDSFASGEGLEDAMFVNPAMLFQTDEFDAVLGSINKSRDGRHEIMMQILLKMSSSSNSIYQMRKKAGQGEPLVIYQPSLTIFGTAVPQYFYKALSSRMLNNGLLARTLVFDAGKRSRGRMPENVDIPSSIIEAASYWAKFNPGGVMSAVNGFCPAPMLVEDTSDAAKKTLEIWELTDDEYEKAQSGNDECRMAIWARSYEKVRKLALIYACSENHKEPKITAQAIEWAWAVVEFQTRRMLCMAELYVAENEFDADCKRVIEVLTKWQIKKKTEFMPHWYLARRLQWSEKKIEDVRNSLIAQQKIETELPTSGPMKYKYRLKC